MIGRRRSAPATSSSTREHAMKATDLIDNQSLRDDLPAFAPGRRGQGARPRGRGRQGTRPGLPGQRDRPQRWWRAPTYTVGKLSYGVGVERTFPLRDTPTVAKLEVVRRGDMRRAKLYYLHDRVGKRAKVRRSASSYRRARPSRCVDIRATGPASTPMREGPPMEPIASDLSKCTARAVGRGPGLHPLPAARLRDRRSAQLAMRAG